MKSLKLVRHFNFFYRREELIFLKLYEGYTQPILFEMKWNMYGFFWEKDSPWSKQAGFTVGFFRDFYQYDAAHINTNSYENETELIKVRLEKK